MEGSVFNVFQKLHQVINNKELFQKSRQREKSLTGVLLIHININIGWKGAKDNTRELQQGEQRSSHEENHGDGNPEMLQTTSWN